MQLVRGVFAAAVCAGVACVSTDNLVGGEDASDAGPEAAPADASPPPADVAPPPADSAPRPVDAGCEADVAADPSNCGACGHVCGGAACVDGTCQPIFITTRPTGDVFDLAIDNASLYYTNNAAAPNGVVVRLDHFNDVSVTLASGLDSPQRIKVYGSEIYFTSYDGNWGLFSCDPSQGCPPAAPTKIAQAGYIPDFERSGTTLYFPDWNVGNVLMCTIGSCTTNTAKLATGQARPWAIALDGARVYWTSIADDAVGAGTIQGCALGGCDGGPTMIKRGLTTPLWLGADSTDLYWSSRSDSPDAGGVSVLASCTSASCESSAADFGFPRIQAGAATRPFVDAHDVIWGETGSGAIYRCPVPACAGGARLIAQRNGLVAVTANDVFVYFIDALGVWRVAR